MSRQEEWQSQLEKSVADDSAPVYELKVSLKHIKPQIWRRVRVPGSVTLEEFHDIIQITMGWQDSHLHAFSINGAEYVPAEQEDTDGLPEERYRLADLGLREKARFQYVYDFGDNWVHEILVSKLLYTDQVPAADRTTPRLLAGKRAAPPEDCGGVAGYYRLAYFLDYDDAPTEESEFWQEMIPEHWNPEQVDIPMINRSLRNEENR